MKPPTLSSLQEVAEICGKQYRRAVARRERAEDEVYRAEVAKDAAEMEVERFKRAHPEPQLDLVAYLTATADE